MRRSVIVFGIIFIGISFSLSSCESATDPDFKESFENVKEVTPIAGAQDVEMNLVKDESLNSFFTVSLNGKSEREAWCIEWDENASFGLNDGTKMYSTRGHEEWKELNYFMGIKDDLRANDPDLTFREIQVVIWSLIEKPSFDVEKISEYENISERIYKDGQPLFDVEKVKNIVNQVHSHFSSAKSKISDQMAGVYFIENNGQTIMVGDETAYAVKTKDGSVDGDVSECFIDQGFGNWGWTNGPISDPSGELTFDIYAGAGQCDLDKGTLVGELTVSYSNGTFTATYKMTETSDFTNKLFTMTETHLYVGNDPFPTNEGSGKSTVSPGQYGNQNTHDYVTEYTYEIDDLSGDIYFIAHAVVNGFDPAD